MSTKIYYAYKVCDNRIKTIFNIKKELESLYAKWVHDGLDKFGHQTLKDIESYMPKGYVFWDVVNRYVTYDEESTQSMSTVPLKEMHSYDLINILKGFIKQGYDYPLNFDASMVLIEHKDTLCIQFFGFNYSFFNDFFENLIKSNTIADWHFQDQTDPPDDVSEEEWAERGSFWDEVFDGYDSSAEIGFCHDFFGRALPILHSYTAIKREIKKAKELAVKNGG